MNWKIIIIGGIVFYLVQFAVGMGIGGPLIHENILDADYRATTEFWRPELVQEPPDMAALMPRWIGAGLLTAFILAGIYGVIRSSLGGAGWMKGLKYGLMLALITGCFCLGYSGIFNLPDKIWGWWIAEGFMYFLPAGAVLGALAQKLAPE